MIENNQEICNHFTTLNNLLFAIRVLTLRIWDVSTFCDSSVQEDIDLSVITASPDETEDIVRLFLDMWPTIGDRYLRPGLGRSFISSLFICRGDECRVLLRVGHKADRIGGTTAPKLEFTWIAVVSNTERTSTDCAGVESEVDVWPLKFAGIWQVFDIFRHLWANENQVRIPQKDI